MSEIDKGNYTIKIIDSTGQFSIKGNGYTDGGRLSSSSSHDLVDAKDLIDLLKTYLLMQKDNRTK